ncbi:septum site-determining protein MinD [Vallitalea okinawensis]|uniref:septum site-determining protein MinD n=1 Tax=Vallitalea okinawensis TaxID=2078660 RepID=UPI000CFCAA80|nr:septum site-determining protein MinD [Vallitalea okinawensis]
MGEVIVVTSGKGGVGKTTCTANIGTALAYLNKKVCIVDADIGLRNLDVVLGLENRICYDIVDVIEGQCRVKQALIKDKRFSNLYLLPASQTRDKNAINPKQMIKLCDVLKEMYDYVLIDCPAGIERGFKNAIAGADRAIVVANPDVSSIRDADRIIGLLENNELKYPSLVVNRFKYKLAKDGNMLTVDDIVDILSIDLIGVVPENDEVIISSNKGEATIRKKDNTEISQSFIDIAKRIQGENVPLPVYDFTSDSFLDKLKSFFRIS